MAWTDKRPMSPHLQIYKLPLTALISVLHRGTGAALTIGTLFLVWVLACAATGPDGYEFAYSVVSSWFGYLVLFGFTFSLYLHLCNGIRHLIWDAGKGYELDEVKHSANMALFVTGGLTLLTWFIVLIG